MKLRKNQRLMTPHGEGYIVQFVMLLGFQSGVKVKGKDFDVNVPRSTALRWAQETENEQA